MWDESNTNMIALLLSKVGTKMTIVIVTTRVMIIVTTTIVIIG